MERLGSGRPRRCRPNRELATDAERTRRTDAGPTVPSASSAGIGAAKVSSVTGDATGQRSACLCEPAAPTRSVTVNPATRSGHGVNVVPSHRRLAVADKSRVRPTERCSWTAWTSHRGNEGRARPAGYSVGGKARGVPPGSNAIRWTRRPVGWGRMVGDRELARSSSGPVSALVGPPGLAQPPCHLLGLPVRGADLLVELDLIEANGCPTGWTAEPRAASQVGRPSSNRVPIGTDKIELLIVRQSYGGASTPNDTRGRILRLTGQAGPSTFRVGGPNSRDAALPS